MFIGPLLLLAGPLLYSGATYRTTGSVLVVVGCLILFAEVMWILLATIHDLADLLMMKPPYALYAGALTLTILAVFVQFC